jgi:hypothetical protein
MYTLLLVYLIRPLCSQNLYACFVLISDKSRSLQGDRKHTDDQRKAIARRKPKLDRLLGYGKYHTENRNHDLQNPIARENPN